ncbi:MAG: molybdopterin synthase [Haloferacaceae archaeon]
MRVLNVVGPGATELTARLVPELDGRVATVERLPDGGADRSPEAAAAYGLGPDGSWVGAGADRSLDGLLDDLAPAFDVALLAGFDDAAVPAVALGDADPAGEAVLRGADAGAVTAEDVLEALGDVEPRVTLESLVRRAKASPRADRAGAIATFTGRVRARDDPNDPRTVRLRFEKYEGVADERLAALSEDLEARDGVHEVLLHHRTGVVEDGEDIVFVVVLAGHREEAFRTVEDGINRLKEEVPLFKKEVTVEDEFWVHERG